MRNRIVLIFLLIASVWQLFASLTLCQPPVENRAILAYYGLLIEVAESEGRFDEARTYTEIALEHAPDSTDLRMKLAEYYYWNAEYERAYQLFKQVYFETGKLDALLRMGDCKELNGNIDSAEHIYRKAYLEYDDAASFQSYYHLVRGYRSTYRAIDLLESHLSTHADSTGLWSELGNLYIDANKPYAAIGAYEKSLDYDVLSLLTIYNLKNYLRSNIYTAVNYTEDRTPRWFYHYKRVFLFMDRRLTDNLYVQMNYLYDDVERKSRLDYLGDDSRYWKHFLEAELSIIPRYDLILSGSIQMDLRREKSSGWHLELDYSPKPLEIELSYDDAVIEYWENRRREHMGLAVTWDDGLWVFGNSFDGYRMKDDEVFVEADPMDVPYGLEIQKQDNYGFSDRLSFRNRVYFEPDISVGGFFTAKSYRYDSRYYYSPDEIYFFGGIAAFHHEVGKYELDIDWEIGLDTEQGRYSAFDSALKMNFEFGSFKLKFEYLRDTDNRQLGFHLVFSDFKL